MQTVLTGRTPVTKWPIFFTATNLREQKVKILLMCFWIRVSAQHISEGLLGLFRIAFFFWFYFYTWKGLADIHFSWWLKRKWENIFDMQVAYKKRYVLKGMWYEELFIKFWVFICSV